MSEQLQPTETQQLVVEKAQEILLNAQKSLKELGFPLATVRALQVSPQCANICIVDAGGRTAGSVALPGDVAYHEIIQELGAQGTSVEIIRTSQANPDPTPEPNPIKEVRAAVQGDTFADTDESEAPHDLP